MPKVELRLTWRQVRFFDAEAKRAMGSLVTLAGRIMVT